MKGLIVVKDKVFDIDSWCQKRGEKKWVYKWEMMKIIIGRHENVFFPLVRLELSCYSKIVASDQRS